MAIVGIGTEIVECVRIAKMIQSHGEQFLCRVYTPDEIDFCAQRPNATMHYATRWAAKEAMMKALNCRNQGVRWTDIEVVSTPGMPPTVALTGAARSFAAEQGIGRMHLSLGGCRTHVTAYVVVTDEAIADG